MNTIRAALVIQQCLFNDFQGNLEKSLALVQKASKLNADFIVFPEMNLTGYAPAAKMEAVAQAVHKKWTDKLTRFSERHNMVILTGLAEKDARGDMYATHLVFQPGLPPSKYRKTHLAPQEKEVFTPGGRVPVFHAKGIHFGIQLCYDAHFPELSTAMALNKADVIFMPHASPRGTCDEKCSSWLRHLTARSFDNGLYIAAVNQCGSNEGGLEFPGVALVIGPDGHEKFRKTSRSSSICMVELDLSAIEAVRSHRMKYFLPNRRSDLL